MLFNDKCTIYNHVETTTGETWKRTVIKGVQWSHNKVESSVNGTSVREERIESVTIDFGRDYGNDTYIEPTAFHKLDDTTGYWTLDNRNKLDVVCFGETPEISTDFSFDDIRDNVQYCGTVTRVSDNRNRDYLKSIKVMLK